MFICTLTCINLSVYFWVGLSVLLPWIYTLHTVLEESPHGSLTANVRITLKVPMLIYCIVYGTIVWPPSSVG